ncbi:MAG TPA: DUF2849 domain-containing protein [Alphaproteobacteria bacterium]|nr:DUF2849 domain-containing protein [Alphaproteobacteria bacterium]
MNLEVVTANRLKDGRTVYLGESGWSENLEEARLAGSAAAAQALLALAERSVERNEVVGPYLIEVIEEGGHLVPARRRERIRAEGPTVAAGSGRQSREIV